MAKSAFPFLHSNIATCYEDLGDLERAEKNHERAKSFEGRPSDEGPFYHGTKADLQIGELLIAGEPSNYKSDITMNHIYFTALVDGAGLAAGLAKGDGRQRVYVVEPIGDFENDPNVTNKKFPGNPTLLSLLRTAKDRWRSDRLGATNTRSHPSMAREVSE